MNCEGCGIEVKVISDSEGTSYYMPVQEELAQVVMKFDVPFRCGTCGALKFPLRPLGDKVFLWPDRPASHDGKIFIPEKMRDEFLDSAVVLGVGPGYHDKAGRFHPTELKPGQRVRWDTGVPWRHQLEGSDGKMYTIPYMGEKDVKAFIVEE